MKKYSKRVYACMFCWAGTEIGKKPKVPVYCSKCKTYLNSDELIVFGSIEEHRVGFEQKTLEGVKVIEDLKHHEKFEFFEIFLVPEKELMGHEERIRLEELPRSQIDQRHRPSGYALIQYKVKNSIRLSFPFSNYESDFSFIQDGKKRVIEVKDLGKKKVTRKNKDVMTGEVIKQKVKIPWPFLSGKPLSQFRLKCQLMKAIYKIDVEIWAGSKQFKFDEKWKLVEVTK